MEMGAVLKEPLPLPLPLLLLTLGAELLAAETMCSLDDDDALERPVGCCCCCSCRLDDEDEALSELVIVEKKPEPKPKLEPRRLESGREGEPDTSCWEALLLCCALAGRCGGCRCCCC